MSTLKVNTIQNASGVEKYLCQAWVNFNGTGTVAIRASGNVAGLIDNNPGDYTIQFTEPMPDVNYAVVAVCNLTTGFGAVVIPTATRTTTSACRAQFWTASGGVDVSDVSVAIFR